MKLAVGLAFLLLFLPANDPDIRFEADGIHLNGSRVEGDALTLADFDSGAFLASGKEIEPLHSELSITVARTGKLILSPGVRAAHTHRGIRLSTRAQNSLHVITKAGSETYKSPIVIERVGQEWIIEGKTRIQSVVLRVESTRSDQAEKVSASSSKEDEDFENRNRPRREVRFRRVFPEDPFLTGKMVDPVSIRQLDPVSPSGE